MHGSSSDVLKGDCGACVGLCCVAPAFAAGGDFAIDKAPRTPCPNLQRDHRCGIHAALRREGFAGCVAYDCFGAGQRVTRAYAGRTWRDERVAHEMFAVFEVVRTLHQLLWWLDDAAATGPRGSLDAATATLRGHTEQLAAADPAHLLGEGIGAHCAAVAAHLQQVSGSVRAEHRGPDHRGADLVEADLRGADLRGAVLVGAWLLGTDLRGADLRLADVRGADLRVADLRGADLSTSLFLTAPQLASARGDGTTRLPPGRPRPAHWAT